MFQEVQIFRQKWVWLVIALSAAIPVVGIVYQVVTGEPFGNNPLPTWGLVLTLLIPLSIAALFWYARLKTLYDEKGVHYRFIPFHFRTYHIHWNEVEQIALRQYDPILEYGGWGLRGLGNNRAYNVSGNIGLQLVLKDERRILFGTKRWQKIEEILKQHDIPFQNTLPVG